MGRSVLEKVNAVTGSMPVHRSQTKSVVDDGLTGLIRINVL
jgi:hypothetical protein